MARSKNEQVLDITGGVIWKQLLSFFFPILLGTLFQQLYTTVDAIVVGNYVGKEALAAVGGATGQIINLFVGFFVGLCSGATVVISQLYGAGDHIKVNKGVHTAVAMSLICGGFLTVFGYIFIPMLLPLLNTPTDIIPAATTYIHIYFASIIFTLIYNIGAGILRAIGDSKRPLYFLIVCCLANVLLDLLFVAVFKMGVFGAAFATALSQVISACLVMITLYRTDLSIQFRFKKLSIDNGLLKRIIKIGLAAGLTSVMYSVSNVTIQANINSFGTDTVAANTVYGSLDSVFWMVINAFGIAITTFVGQNYGARKFKRIVSGVKTCALMALIATICVSVLVCLGGPAFLGIMTKDPNVHAIGRKLLFITPPFYFTFVLIEVLSGTLRGMGDTLRPTIITALGICVFRVIYMFTVATVFHSIVVTMLSYPISWALTSTVYLLYYKQQKKKLILPYINEELPQ